MRGFTAEWLALREPADRAARDPGLAQRFGAALPPQATILDLGAGTGAHARAMSEWVREQRWVLVENDPTLLALQPSEFDSVARDLADGLGDLPADGVAMASLLDLAGATWLEQLAKWVARRRVPLLAVLTVDGRRDYWPADPEDAAVAAAFARDQRRDKGLGPAVGAAASAMLAKNLARRCFSVSTAASDWRLGPGQSALLAALVQGEAEAAKTPGWGRRRLAQIEAGRLRARIGHRDLLALPPAS
jgi:hypothetical protein